jgi:hypothetical protein
VSHRWGGHEGLSVELVLGYLVVEVGLVGQFKVQMATMQGLQHPLVDHICAFGWPDKEVGLGKCASCVHMCG